MMDSDDDDIYPEHELQDEQKPYAEVKMEDADDDEEEGEEGEEVEDDDSDVRVE